LFSTPSGTLQKGTLDGTFFSWLSAVVQKPETFLFSTRIPASPAPPPQQQQQPQPQHVPEGLELELWFDQAGSWKSPGN